jgi:hypothetical protein
MGVLCDMRNIGAADETSGLVAQGERSAWNGIALTMHCAGALLPHPRGIEVSIKHSQV